tara:strand:- start:239 stop:355 length:117 start_codon:yes stop_codon:yes gene_type:complete
MKSRAFPHNPLTAALLGTLWFASVSGLGYIWIMTVNAY